MEELVIGNLPNGTRAAIEARARQHNRTVEAEARSIIADAIVRAPSTMVDLLAAEDGADIDFEPGLLGSTARSADL